MNKSEYMMAMDMKEEILKLTRELVAIPSVSDTEDEHLASDYIATWLKSLPFFEKNQELTGRFLLPEDCRGRHIVYALVPGRSKKTFVLSGHVDVVAAADFGEEKDAAFDCKAAAAYLKTCELDEDSARDLAEGGWLFGRGSCDMKGGMAAAMTFVKEYAQREEKPGSLLFLAVPDEESYSAGMRSAGRLMLDLKRKYGLSFELLVNPEPNSRIGNEHIVSIGSAGKCMPVILVQGAKAHICKCFEGLNPMGIMGEIFARTELSLEFTDSCDGEITVPPTWLWLKDMKEEYDVSIPVRTSAYINMISFSSTPEDILKKLIPVCREAFEAYVDKMKGIYAAYQSRSKYPSDYEISYEPCVMTLQELTELLFREKKEAYPDFYKKLYGEIAEKIRKGSLNYPQATILMMDRLLTFSGIDRPLVLLGFAPPYYPAVRSDHVKGKEKIGQRALAAADRVMQQYGSRFVTENYTVGLSDTSYCCMDKKFDYVKYSQNTPLWGSLYSIDFDLIERIDVPGLVLGPWGKDLHKKTERVNIQSLTEEYPKVLRAISEAVWEG